MTVVTFKDKEYFTTLLEDHIVKVNKEYKESAYTFSDEIFNGEQRLSYDVNLNQNFGKTDDELYGANEDYIAVRTFLKNNNYEIINYGSGICKKLPSDDEKIDTREYKIGRILSRLGADIKIQKYFENGSTRENCKQAISTLMITISRLPYDVASMSTGRGWSSCMSMSNGCNANYVLKDISHGTHIAYLHLKTDMDIKNPISRVLLKPFRKEKSRSNKNKILEVERTVYGANSKEFRNFVVKWASDNFAIKEDCTLNIISGLYNDGIGSTKVYISETSPKITSENKEDRIYASKYGSDIILKKMIDDKSPDVINNIINRCTDKELVVNLIMKNENSKNLFKSRIEMFNILNKEQKEFVKTLIKENIESREFVRPVLKHYEKSQVGIEFYIEEDYDGLCNNICRDGANDIVRAYLEKHNTIFNRIEIARRIPRQLDINVLKDIIDSISLMGAYAILKHDHIDVVNDEIDGKSAEDYLIYKFPSVKELVNNSKLESSDITKWIKENNREITDEEFLEYIK